MADYSDFPFSEFSHDEITRMMVQSVLLHDVEFVVACREQLKRSTPGAYHGTSSQTTSTTACSCNPPEGFPHLPTCACAVDGNCEHRELYPSGRCVMCLERVL